MATFQLAGAPSVTYGSGDSDGAGYSSTITVFLQPFPPKGYSLEFLINEPSQGHSVTYGCGDGNTAGGTPGVSMGTLTDLFCVSNHLVHIWKIN